ncbi:60S ribosomal protein L22 [Tieghemiomyces parasiticus]|uniref:Large ribosomal subunit protein eL22 n=1 Tax=Tieghemiomyces parasiticus TaxID=78921 RepID=A0A9W8AHE5_9FUNG|nr:60S ribosomal protein L22 [Tieghemiomyces parasiticus]
MPSVSIYPCKPELGSDRPTWRQCWIKPAADGSDGVLEPADRTNPYNASSSPLPTHLPERTTHQQHKASKLGERTYTLDCAAPVNDSIFDLAAFEKFLHDRIKVEGRLNNLSGRVTITRTDDSKISVTTEEQFAKRYLKYLAKRFLKKHQLQDWLRVVATDKTGYQLRYYNINQNAGGDDEEESEEEEDDEEEETEE